ncbi:MAG: 30S ribosomal protein S6, partial [Desulfobacteraceae bacterium]|nr:30S ribosomal protein S6 [Desulfobacteraceae bacterium]
MRRYETIIIIDPDLSEEERAPLIERFEELITQHDGLLIQQDPWGTKKLAYEIKKKPRGYYLRLDYAGIGTLVDEMERFCRIDDRVLKYMTILLAEDVDIEQVRAELAEAEAQKTRLAAEAEPETDKAPAV